MIGKKFLVGITGSIAAYKAAMLIRLLIKEGAEVRVVMTPLAKEFITPLTLATLAKHPILIDFFDPTNGAWNSHVDLGIWADGYIIAPASANTIAKMANGIADNLLLTSYLSARCQTFFAPAMDLDMYNHPATQQNIQTLIKRGHICIEPASGELASGLSGKGRMEEPEVIVDKIKEYYNSKLTLKNKKILITAGPTQEKIDPVRFISNHSTGKMGYALAEVAANQGADVVLVSGNVNIQPKNPKIQLIKVVSAKQMYQACKAEFENSDITILAAAVADYKPKIIVEKKIKKANMDLTIELEKTVDIASELGKIKKNNQLNIGFALETDNEIENAKSKLKRKNMDIIVLNSLQHAGAGFGFDTNQITIIDKNNNIEHFELKTKHDAAKDIINKIIQLLH